VRNNASWLKVNLISATSLMLSGTIALVACGKEEEIRLMTISTLVLLKVLFLMIMNTADSRSGFGVHLIISIFVFYI